MGICTDPTGPGQTQTDPTGPGHTGQTQTDPDILDRPGRTAGFRWVPLGSAGFHRVLPGSSGFIGLHRVPLISAGFRWVPLVVFNDRLLGANLQLVPGCHTLAACSPKTFGLFFKYQLMEQL